ncbi:MAG: 6,7-dimethyl-8-ribityllumazine synthase [Bacteroidaceae bacterium]|nr:6,7-dimethyl-8-ribityllumazine synthase [Bacteroidaceae bacterium]
MATRFHNLSEYDLNAVPDASEMTFGIVVSEWNDTVTGALLDGAIETLKKHGAKEDNIDVRTVPGSFELVYGASKMLKSRRYDAILAFGCVVRGDTPHFDYICQGATQGLAHLNTLAQVPVVYGLLTCDTMQQALDRCGGALGNKGCECAVTAIKMVRF